MSIRLYIVWSPQWELGIPLIDEQHRGLVSLVNTHFYFITERRGEDVVMPLISALNRYWSLHCMTEEELLTASGYPEIKHQIKEHREFSAQLSALMRGSIKTQRDALISDDLMIFLKEILIGHITAEDFNYVSHVKKFLAEESKAVPEEPDSPLKNVGSAFSRLHINWSPRLELGIPIIDEQHRGMTSLTNTLFFFASGNRGEDITIPLIKAMERYWSLHSITEEELLIQSRYPKTESHLNRHFNLVNHLLGFIPPATKSKNKTEVLNGLLNFVDSEQVAHSHREDSLFVPHMKKYLRLQHEI